MFHDLQRLRILTVEKDGVIIYFNYSKVKYLGVES